MSESAQQRGKPGTREALLDAVDELLAERGWAACSLQAVARRAGLTTGAVYSTFGSRGALLAAALVRQIGEQAGLPKGVRDLRKAVRIFASGYHAATLRTEGVYLLLAQLDLVRLAATDQGIADALKDVHQRQVEDLRQDIASRGGDASRTQQLVAVLQGLALQQIAFGGQVSERTFVEAALHALDLAT